MNYKQKNELVESIAKLLASVHRPAWQDMTGTKERQKDFDNLDVVGKHTYLALAGVAIDKIAFEIREKTIEEIKQHIGSKVVPIEGTSYSCGPREWIKFIEKIQ